MNRRGFLRGILNSTIALSAGGIALLEPGPIRRYFLPPRGGWRSSDAEFITFDSTFDDFTKRYIQPAMIRLAEDMDRALVTTWLQEFKALNAHNPEWVSEKTALYA